MVASGTSVHIRGITAGGSHSGCCLFPESQPVGGYDQVSPTKELRYHYRYSGRCIFRPPFRSITVTGITALPQFVGTANSVQRLFPAEFGTPTPESFCIPCINPFTYTPKFVHENKRLSPFTLKSPAMPCAASSGMPELTECDKA